MINVLVVDDSKLQRIANITVLEKLGYTIVGEAENGQEGYEKYKELKPDLVTMDINMPVLDGIGAVKKIVDEFPKAVIFMISSESDRSLVYDAIGFGATDFIMKPIDEEIFRKKIRHALKLG